MGTKPFSTDPIPYYEVPLSQTRSNGNRKKILWVRRGVTILATMFEREAPQTSPESNAVGDVA